MPKSLHEIYGNRVRVRACGVCVVENKILMVNHSGLTDGDFWAPPGGGLGMHETAHQAVEREFLEETNLKVKPGDLLFVTEYYKAPLHAIELFFNVALVEGTLKKGLDPEMKPAAQAIVDVRFLSWGEIAGMDGRHLHGAFKFVSEPAKILDLRGYIKL
ncbi:MAG: NUDIX domain-containing protein [Cyclobacteriaceae bacterium]|nr:NUDIX domain-containing protein [Cyclobacteriaceae bacterium]MCB9238885.1 NUDIX domain-containing protein [Flammeovirgaceae bacterium]MCB0498161.1 NUDIX domain-containing protein [Cyclobacteriaceae bacterium]MCO5270604.1 NUDIX domain-containing protein [Cyclobacteriaceae bacterium]MCW5900955.1 NUDIX domain-containing protein [Cyclobacteriaceae bacterium]